MKRNLEILSFFILLLISGCGDKLDLSEFPITNDPTNNTTVEDTSYVQQSPTWNQFNKPADIIIGNEPIVYIADTENDRVVQLDLSGAEIASIYIENPIALAQDKYFDILIIGDSVLSETFDTISVVYRLKLVEVGGIISNAAKIPLITSEYATPLTSRERRFTGIATLPDNDFFITRIGPENGSIDPDNAILRVSGRDNVSEVVVLSGFQTTGNGIYSIEKTSSIATFPYNENDFIITRNTSDAGFKVEWFVYDEANGSYVAQFLPEDNVDLLQVGFGAPEDVTVDSYSNIYVVDSENDSLYKFNSYGNLLPESFGGEGVGDNQLYLPKGVAYFSNVLYIADTGNNRVVRYKLSTDIK